MSGAEPAELVGSWALSRRVADRGAGVRGTVRGELEIVPDGEGVRWVERGVLRWGGVERPVRRAYLLRDTGDGWWVHFEDGSAFHPWRPGQWVTRAARMSTRD